MNKYMKMAIDEAYIGINRNHGGPFGCVIVKDNMIIAKDHNVVLKNNDSTCHGEIMAIRKACKKLNSFDLKDCELYTTGEPCPMCLCACMWANIKKIYYGCTLEDNGIIGFRDKKFEEIFKGREKIKDYLINIDREDCIKLFNDYKKLNRPLY